jgi:cytidylate kinase
MVIALDGPAGAGKSTVARAAAAALGFTYLDTGAMYRCVALEALRSGERAEVVAAEIEIQLGDRVLIDREDVTDEIRTAAVSEEASVVASLLPVRRAMVAQQQQMLRSGDGWVAEGRDIGTVVWPQAELKVFLTASAEARARRRAAETGLPYDQILADQLRRDARDMGRADSPLRPAHDAVEVDTTGLGLDEVVARIVDLARGRGCG